MKKRYLTSLWTRQSYSMWIVAESEEEAKKIAEKHTIPKNWARMEMRKLMRFMW